jgi:hypothetical protein
MKPDLCWSGFGFFFVAIRSPLACHRSDSVRVSDVGYCSGRNYFVNFCHRVLTRWISTAINRVSDASDTRRGEPEGEMT